MCYTHCQQGSTFAAVASDAEVEDTCTLRIGPYIRRQLPAGSVLSAQRPLFGAAFAHCRKHISSGFYLIIPEIRYKRI